MTDWADEMRDNQDESYHDNMVVFHLLESVQETQKGRRPVLEIG